MVDESDLLCIPGVGKNTKEDLQNIGIASVEDLIGKNPYDLYLKDCEYKGYTEDRCQLYVFRLAVYYAENEIKDSSKLNWWYWKDKKYNEDEKNSRE